MCVLRERERDAGLPVFLSSNEHAFQEEFAPMIEPYRTLLKKLFELHTVYITIFQHSDSKYMQKQELTDTAK